MIWISDCTIFIPSTVTMVLAPPVPSCAATDSGPIKTSKSASAV
jgi:hypothetical protein